MVKRHLLGFCVLLGFSLCSPASRLHAQPAAGWTPGSGSMAVSAVMPVGSPSAASLPDAPEVARVEDAGSSGKLLEDAAPAIKAVRAGRKQDRGPAAAAERTRACENGTLTGSPCRVQWGRLLGESFLLLAGQHTGNIAMDKDTRYNLTHGGFWSDYVACVKNYRWSRWKDDDPVGVDYIGHPMMGALTSSLYEQNDPKQRALTFENTHRYWMGRLRAMAFSAAYSAQWKVGPLSEASIGNTGIGYYVRASDGVVTNETGMQDFFVTPIGGLAWNVGEDAIDRWILGRVRQHTRNRMVLFLSAFATPQRSGANLLRFRAPYYRDSDVEPGLAR